MTKCLLFSNRAVVSFIGNEKTSNYLDTVLFLEVFKIYKNENVPKQDEVGLF